MGGEGATRLSLLLISSRAHTPTPTHAHDALLWSCVLSQLLDTVREEEMLADMKRVATAVQVADLVCASICPRLTSGTPASQWSIQASSFKRSTQTFGLTPRSGRKMRSTQTRSPRRRDTCSRPDGEHLVAVVRGSSSWAHPSPSLPLALFLCTQQLVETGFDQRDRRRRASNRAKNAALQGSSPTTPTTAPATHTAPAAAHPRPAVAIPTGRKGGSAKMKQAGREPG